MTHLECFTTTGLSEEEELKAICPDDNNDGYLASHGMCKLKVHCLLIKPILEEPFLDIDKNENVTLQLDFDLHTKL